MLTPRNRKIILMLLDRTEAISAKELARALNVSLRSIRYDLKTLNELQAELGFNLISIPGKGMFLEIDDKQSLREKLAGLSPYQAPVAPEERKKRIIYSLLVEKGKTPEYLADKFEVSLGTVYRDLKQIESELDGHLSLNRARGKLEITGSEVKKREKLVELLTSLSENVDDLGRRWFTDLPTEESAAVNQSLEYCQTALGYKLTDSSYLALYIHLLIALQRVRAGNRIIIDQDLLNNIARYPEYHVACNIAQLLHQKTGIEFPEAEQGHIAVHLLGSKVRERSGLLADVELRKTVFSFVHYFELDYGITGLSSDSKLLDDLAMHLRPALKRKNFKLPAKNPLLNRLQTEFTDIFQSARVACQQLAETESLNEDELGFLVMHLAAALERLKKPNTIKAVVICSTGLGSARLLSERVTRRFPNIEVTAVASALERNFPAETQLIISTVPLHLSIPVVQVSPLLTGDEIAKLERAIYDNQSSLNSHIAFDSIMGAIRRHCIIIDKLKLLSDLEICLGLSTAPPPEDLLGLEDMIRELEQVHALHLDPDAKNGLKIHFLYTAKRLQQGCFWQEPELEQEKLKPQWEAAKKILQRSFDEWNLPWSEHEVPPVLRYFELEE